MRTWPPRRRHGRRVDKCLAAGGASALFGLAAAPSCESRDRWAELVAHRRERKKDEPTNEPVSGTQVVGQEGGQAIYRDEQRAKAAAAADARAQKQQRIGQQGPVSKIKKPAEQSINRGGVENDLVWD